MQLVVGTAINHIANIASRIRRITIAGEISLRIKIDGRFRNIQHTRIEVCQRLIYDDLGVNLPPLDFQVPIPTQSCRPGEIVRRRNIPPGNYGQFLNKARRIGICHITAIQQNIAIGFQGGTDLLKLCGMLADIVAVQRQAA